MAATIHGFSLDKKKTHGFSFATSTSTSTSSSPCQVLDVSLSFWGEERRYAFADNLNNALRVAKISVFMEKEPRRPGTDIVPSAIQAIHKSRICVVILSRSYASSKWCLDELVCIMECWKRENKLVLPIFYGVDPSEVRSQKGRVADALNKHRYTEKSKMLKWRAALTQAANISGWDLNSKNDSTVNLMTTLAVLKKNEDWRETDRREERNLLPVQLGNMAELIGDIVKCIQSKGLPSRLNISIYPLRYDVCDEYLNVFLQAGSQDVVIVGICGPSQMGKTAMARVMYDRILHNFDGGCFLADVGQISNQPNYQKGLIHLQEKLLSDILSERVRISNASIGVRLIEQKLCSKRVLVVLDNVDHLIQMYALIGDRSFFGSGSKIIITTRNVKLLEVFRVDQILLAQGRPLPPNVAGIWEQYQRSRCTIAGLKEFMEAFNQQTQEKLRYLEAILLQERQKKETQARLISELLEARSKHSASLTSTMTKKDDSDNDGLE